MSRPAERSNRAHLAIVETAPTRHPHIQGLARKLGHAAVLGGADEVERVGYSDDVFLAIDAKVRKKAMAMIRQIAKDAAKNPRSKRKPSPHERNKIDWTGAFTARFLFEAPRSSDDRDLCRRLGLPTCCRGSMRAARSRHGILRVSATVKPAKPERAPLAFVLPLAA